MRNQIVLYGARSLRRAEWELKQGAETGYIEYIADWLAGLVMCPVMPS